MMLMYNVLHEIFTYCIFKILKRYPSCGPFNIIGLCWVKLYGYYLPLVLLREGSQCNRFQRWLLITDQLNIIRLVIRENSVFAVFQPKFINNKRYKALRSEWGLDSRVSNFLHWGTMGVLVDEVLPMSLPHWGKL